MQRQSYLALITVLLSTIFALFLVEQALRWYAGSQQAGERMDPGLIRYHAERGWHGAAYWAGEHHHRDYSVRYSTDARGFRESGATRSAGGVIALLGDSFTFGLGVNDTETFAARLNQQDPSSAYLNLGVPGYSTDQQLLLLESETLPQRPDAVLLCFYLGNDLLDNALAYPLQATQAKPYFALEDGTLILRNTPVPRAPKPARLQSTTLRTIIFGDELDRLEPWWARLISSSLVLNRLLSNRSFVARQDVERILEARLAEQKELLAALVQRLNDQVMASGARLILVPLPGRSFVQDPESYSALFQEHTRAWFVALASENDVEVIDAATLLRSRYLDAGGDLDLFHPNDGHFTVEGHAAVASIILEGIQR